jgi:hypothetical protein
VYQSTNKNRATTSAMMQVKRRITMSLYLGWVLISLGVLTYAGGFIVSLKEYATGPQTQGRALSGTDDLKAVAEVLDKLADVLDKFGKLSIPIQWALLGLLNIGIGTYLITHRPF